MYYKYWTEDLYNRFFRVEKKLGLIFLNADFQKELTSIIRFYDSKDSGEDVLKVLINENKRLANLRPMGFRRFFYRSVVAETIGDNVYFNSRFFYRKDPEQANTLTHEWLHFVGYTHGNKNNPQKYPEILNSVPYRVGEIVEKYYEKLFS